MIEHIFTDLDGTLLKTDGGVSDYNQQVIKDINVPVTLVSARSPQEMMPIITTLGLTDAQIGFNGGIVFKVIEESELEIVSDCPVSKKVAKRVAKLIETYFPSLSINYYSQSTWYTHTECEEVLFQQEITGECPVVDTGWSAFEEEADSLYKIMLISLDKDVILEATDFLSQLSIPELTIYASGPHHIEMTDKRVTKSVAIQELMIEHQLRGERVAAFGDGHNDIPMLQLVGHSVAMSNATVEVKDVATFITESNDDDGVGRGIERLISQMS